MAQTAEMENRVAAMEEQKRANIEESMQARAQIQSSPATTTAGSSSGQDA